MDKQKRKKIFEGRSNLYPTQYPEAERLLDAIRHSYWLDNEVRFDIDKNNFRQADDDTREIIKKTLLAISTVEVKVKDFWGKIGDYFPHPEISGLGATHSESEVRHTSGYSRLLKELMLFEEFEKVFEVPQIKGRYNYLNKYLRTPTKEDGSPLEGDAFKRAILIKIILFSILIENVSLFSQFAIIIYLNKFHNIMGNTKNIIDWTVNEETIHFHTGAFLVNTIREEYPHLFDGELEEEVLNACRESVVYESAILDWIFETKEFELAPKESFVDFLKDRVNTSLGFIDFPKAFEEDLNLSPTRFFYEETTTATLDDFFARRPVDYTVNDRPFTGDDLF